MNQDAPASTGPSASLLVRGSLLIIGLQLVVAFLTRCALAWQGRALVDWGFGLAGAFLGGLWFDLLAALYSVIVWCVIAFLVPGTMWRSSAGRWLMGLVFGTYGVVFVFISVAEWFFWDEFQVRFNFIAVDYLVYTQEVIDNIQQSYPMPLIFGGLALAGVAVAAVAARLGLLRWVTAGDTRWTTRLWQTAAFAALITGISFAFSQTQLPRFANEFNREIAKNGIYAFCAAFWESEIDYERFYLKHPPEQALAEARVLLETQAAKPATTDARDLRRVIKHEGAEKRWNVVLVSVESLSAEFIAHHKHSSDLTPHIDRMMDEGLWFASMYATGTRTVRGLEALTLSVPPTPGQSIVWRPHNEHLFSIGSLFQERGYDTAYVYGGDAMFDNMNYFFSNNGYRVVDRQAKKAADITFQNAWGVCDDDLFRWATQEADADHAAGKPFFLHVMTVSNHRPFTFPEGVEGVPAEGGGRKAGVRYTDHSIGAFIDGARTKPWFANTLFVVVADHCHGSAGKVELDVTKYHIPCVMWNPQLVQPRVYKPLVSQIDVAPTILGLMNWSYTSRFYGEDVLDSGYSKDKRRAWVSNYQKIALLREDGLAILEPKQQYVLGKVTPRTGAFVPDSSPPFQKLLHDTVSYYQSASWLFHHGHLGADVSVP